MTKPRNYEEDLGYVCDAMADAVSRLTDEEILEEARVDGIDAHAVGEELRGRAKAIGEAIRLAPLRAARAKFESDKARLIAFSSQLPGDATTRRALLASTLARHPELTTLAARDLRDLPDNDVTSMLHDLAALGVLDE
jgi:hypothetical protein